MCPKWYKKNKCLFYMCPRFRLSSISALIFSIFYIKSGNQSTLPYMCENGGLSLAVLCPQCSHHHRPQRVSWRCEEREDCRPKFFYKLTLFLLSFLFNIVTEALGKDEGHLYSGYCLSYFTKRVVFFCSYLSIKSKDDSGYWVIIFLWKIGQFPYRK
jgi:hypothetical protein